MSENGNGTVDPMVEEAQKHIEGMTKRYGWMWQDPKVEYIRFATHEPGFTICRIDVSIDDNAGQMEGLGATKRYFRMDNEQPATAQAVSRYRAIQDAYAEFMRWYLAPRICVPVGEADTSSRFSPV